MTGFPIKSGMTTYRWINIVRISVQVHPGAKQNAIVRLENGIWHIKIAALPVEGKANKELIEFLSEVLGVSKSRITIEKGMTSRKKLIAIEGIKQGEVEKKLERLFSG